MDLGAQQRELARRAVGIQSGDDPSSDLPLEQVEAFARSLVRKRALEVRSCLPRTAEALGADFIAEFGRYAAEHPVQGAKKHAVDALAFARNLDARAPAWIAELARYEAAWVEMGLGRKLLLRKFRYAVDESDSACAQMIWVVWIRLPWGRGARGWRCWPPRLAEKKSGAQERT